MKGIRGLFFWTKKHFVSLIIIIVLNFILQWLYSYLPMFISYIFKVIDNKDTNVDLPLFLLDFFAKYDNLVKLVFIVSVTMVLLQLIRSIMRFFSSYLEGHLTQNIQSDMRINLYNHIGDLSYSYHNNVDTGDLIQRCTSDIDTASGFVSTQFPQFINIFVTIFIGAYRVGSINSLLMWVSLIVVPFLGVSSIFFNKYVNKKFLEVEEAESKMTTCISENVNSCRVVRAFSNERYEFEKMDKANMEFRKKDMQLGNVFSLYWGFSDFIVYIQYMITIVVAIHLGQKGLVDAGDLATCIFLMGMLVWPIRGLGRIVSNYGKTIVATNRLSEILEEKSEYEINGSQKPEINGNIEFKNVSFKFPDDSKNLLTDVSFSIKSGETVAIVGKTGCGKTTICNLLTRMLEYDNGDILINGVSLKDIDKKHLRQNIKMVLQDPFLFSKTVYENIAIVNKDVDEEKVFNAAKIAHIDNDIKKFESGYKTLVGEKGTTLSGGQKQRIAISRILVEPSKIVIFDDSLSALDTKTDLLIRNSLKSKIKDQTAIIITHRTTSAKEADKIIVLNNGVVEAIGTHEELANKEGFYKGLWEIQGKLEEEFLKILNGGE